MCCVFPTQLELLYTALTMWVSFNSVKYKQPIYWYAHHAAACKYIVVQYKANRFHTFSSWRFWWCEVSEIWLKPLVTGQPLLQYDQTMVDSLLQSVAWISLEMTVLLLPPLSPGSPLSPPLMLTPLLLWLSLSLQSSPLFTKQSTISRHVHAAGLSDNCSIDLNV